MAYTEKNELGYIPELALFDKPAIDTGVLAQKWVRHEPISQISNGVLQFVIPPTAKSYINLKSSTLQVQGKVVREDGSDLDENEFAALINAPLHSIWRQVDLSLQQKIVTNEVGDNYPYKAYLDLLLNLGIIQQTYQLSSQAFIMDPEFQMDNLEYPIGGIKIRGLLTKKSKLLQLEGPLLLDLAQQDRYILNGVEIKLKFWPSMAPFNMLSLNEGYRFKILNAHLNLCTVNIAPGILVGHAEALKIAPALYPYFHSEIKTYTLPSGVYQYTMCDLFQGRVPSDLIVGLVSQDSYNGQYDKNPFNFQHYDCNFIGFYVDSVSVPGHELQPKFKLTNNGKNRRKRSLPSGASSNRNKKRKRDIDHGRDEEEIKDKEGEEKEGGEDSGYETDPDASDTDKKGGNNGEEYDAEAYTEAFLSLFGHQYNTLETIPLDMSQYANGYSLFRFPINRIKDPEHRNTDYLSLTESGSTMLRLKFRKALPESVTAIIYAKFPEVLRIDEARNVIIKKK
jgi:hypothetical protein